MGRYILVILFASRGRVREFLLVKMADCMKEILLVIKKMERLLRYIPTGIYT
jgi:hypothetical protein